MRIRVLGCSGGIGPNLRTTSLLVGDDTLIDAGTGVGDLSLRQMQKIRRVILTHSHLDHVCGLAFLADNLFDMVEGPVDVLATPETLQALRAHLFNWVLWPDFSKLPDEQHGFLRFVELPEGATMSLHDATLQSFRVRHTVPAVGYSMDNGRHCFAFTGDTCANDQMWDYLNALPRLDKLMIEVAFPDEQEALGELSRHFTPRVLGEELRKLRHRPELLLTHHKPGCEELIERECRNALSAWDYIHLERGFTIQF